MSRPDPISIRIAEDTRSAIQKAADDKGRSLNAEIRMRLQWSIGRFEEAASDAVPANEIESLRALVRALETRLYALEKKVSYLDGSGEPGREDKNEET